LSFVQTDDFPLPEPRDIDGDGVTDFFSNNILPSYDALSPEKRKYTASVSHYSLSRGFEGTRQLLLDTGRNFVLYYPSLWENRIAALSVSSDRVLFIASGGGEMDYLLEIVRADANLPPPNVFGDVGGDNYKFLADDTIRGKKYYYRRAKTADHFSLTDTEIVDNFRIIK
jgi:hypothetical protein